MRFRLPVRTRAPAAVLAGLVALGLSADIAGARPGDLDPGFSKDGKVRTSFGEYDAGQALIAQPDGRLVAAGIGEQGDQGSVFALARYLPNGSLDRSFGDRGRQTTDFGAEASDFGAEGAFDAVALADGRIVAAGGFDPEDMSLIDPSSAIPSVFALARYQADGAQDTSFGVGGAVTTGFGSADAAAAGVAAQADGKLVVVGTVRTPSAPADIALARYEPDGGLDPSFSDDGIVTTDLGGYDTAAALAIQPDGRIVVAAGSGGDLAIARYRTDGSLDPALGGDGAIVVDLGRTERAADVVLQDDGRIVAVGDSFRSRPCCGTDRGNLALVRLGPDGSLDPSFSDDGTQTTDFGGDDFAASAALQGDGRIIAVGGQAAPGGAVVLARYDADGALDRSFGGDGRVTTGFSYFGAGANAVAVQPDGSIVTAGDAYLSGEDSFETSDFALARYRVGTGPADADADGVGDRPDRCVDLFGPGTVGCPLYERRVSLEYSRRERAFRGTLEARLVTMPKERHRALERECEIGRRVAVFERRRGRDRRLGVDRSSGSRRFRVEAGAGDGVFYARALRALDSELGICKAARSRGVRAR